MKDMKKGVPFKPCKDCPTPAKCIRAGKCLMAEDDDEKDEKKAYKTISKMASAMGLKK